MRLDFNRKYTTIAVYAFLTCAAVILFLSTIIYREEIMDLIGSVIYILNPILYGFAIAYVISPLEKLLRNLFAKPFSKSKKDFGGLCKFLSVTITYILVLAIVIGFCFMMVPQLGDSIASLKAKMPGVYEKILAFANEHELAENPFFETRNMSFVEISGKVYDFVEKFFPQMSTFVGNIVNETKNIIIGVFVSVYILVSKDRFKKQIKKFLHAVISKQKVDKINGFFGEVDSVFSRFITGKILDSAIIGVICFAAMSILGMPYTALVSVIVGVTNIIPVFGPFIGAIPSTLIILIDSPTKAFWFVILIILLQQLDGNFIGPKILGETTGLPAFWIMFSLILFGGLYGVFGMIIAVPLFALIYNGIRVFTNRNLAECGMSTNTDDY